MNTEIQTYNDTQTTPGKEICDLLATTIDSVLTEAENKIWHVHPVWFLDNNPIVGYSKQKAGWRLMAEKITRNSMGYKNIVKRKGVLELK